MMRRTVVLIAVILLAGLVGAQEANRTLVLKDGQTIEVQNARLAGGMVYVTLPNGAMRGYAIADVDMEASGLVPKKAEQAPAAPAEPPTLVALAKKDRGKPRVTITDADVAHVDRSAEDLTPEQEAAAEKKAKGTLTVAVNGYERKGQELTVKGQIANQGKVPISGIRLEAQVKDGTGKVVRRAQKAIEGAVEGGKAKNFTMTFTLPEGDVAGVDVRVVGAVAPVEMQRPSPKPGEPSEGE